MSGQPNPHVRLIVCYSVFKDPSDSLATSEVRGVIEILRWVVNILFRRGEINSHLESAATRLGDIADTVWPENWQ